MSDARTLTIDQFEDLVGSDFELAGPETMVRLSLVEVENKGMGERKGGAFSILWQGPVAPVLPQQTYTITHPVLGSHAYFIVPVAEKDAGIQYEAVFT